MDGKEKVSLKVQDWPESQFCTIPPFSCWCTKLSFLSLLVIYDSDDSESMFLIERLVRFVQARFDLLPDISDCLSFFNIHKENFISVGSLANQIP